MKATYYSTLKTKLQGISDIEFVGRWKNQIEGDQIAKTPCVFIEFPVVTYNDNSAKQQSADNVEVVLHLIVIKNTSEDSEDTRLYDISQKIYNVLQNTDGFSRQSESLDVSYDSLEDFQLTYLIGRLVDEDAAKEYSEIDRPTPVPYNQMKEPDGS